MDLILLCLHVLLRQTGKKMPLKIRCREHLGYTAEKKSASSEVCDSCKLLYILRWQHSNEPDKHLGGINPYQFIYDLEEACAGLQAKP